MEHPRKDIRQAVLAHRIQRAKNRLAGLQKIESRFPWLRLGIVLVGIGVIVTAFQLLRGLLPWAAVLLALAVFALAAAAHRRLIEQIEQMEAFIQMLATHIARSRLDWPEMPAPAQVSVMEQHPFAADLSITGERSLHQLLDTCASLGGSLCLAGWLLEQAPDPTRTLERQEVVRELVGRPTFRARLELKGIVAGRLVGQLPARRQRWDAGALLRWLESHTSAASLRAHLIVLGLLAAANIVLFALNALGSLPPLWIGTFILYFGLQSLKYRESSDVFGEAYDLANQLGQLRIVLSDLENYPYQSAPGLAQRAAPLWQGSECPSTALRQISRIAAAASLRRNPVFSLVLNILVPWDLYFAYRLERAKIALRAHLPAWLEAWYELEALSALANFASLNPETTYPDILAVDARPVFEAVAIGHPLIPIDPRVNNDFALPDLGEIRIITGSNMSGKSTFLRTVGINLVLAFAGTTVAAQQLRTIPFRLFTSMTLNDSLSDGISFFYAEVRRLKSLLDKLNASNRYPLFFMIDEIFRGTNNRERQVGSRAYAQSLAGRNGTGLISTHDLELAHLDETIPAVQNFHFREDIHDERMIFDYKIHPGPSPTTNALRIMALAGLPVERDTQ